ncbi:glycosyltransferase [Paludisphaera mucosa]|uniref:Glycosyltransferase n=1 Tax=Paludisphaera mucosa TaxID=3030827 RepID=A0ABT6F3Z7_9BACT|nr:nucleotide disphospho-sugar-binding domain-containing protein [Paludisphaera mucosa]MDG3002307.1 glycosyltransferase [Paludisphaera mucosa]
MSLPSPGHAYPMAALGRKLQSKGHEVVVFQLPDYERRVREAGLEYREIGRTSYPPGSMREIDARLGRLKGMAALRYTIREVAGSTRMVLDDAPDAIRAAGVEALVVDQAQVAGGTVAERLGLPFVSVALALPLNVDAETPPFQFPWRHREGFAARLRNRAGHVLAQAMGWPVAKVIQSRRRAWGMPLLGGVNAAFSRLAQITQLPAALELPGRRVPPTFHYTGPWTDPAARAAVDFPWDRLDPVRPMVYVSMGTLQNQRLPVFLMIAQACAGLDLQLVISLGGGSDPAALGGLPGDPIVVGFAPQLELIGRARLTIGHGGLNTTLESLEKGVPTVVLPVTNDQPGVGVRVEHAGVGRSVPVARASADRIREAVRTVLDDPGYRERASALRASIEAADGLNRAADLVAAAFAAAGR